MKSTNTIKHDTEPLTPKDLIRHTKKINDNLDDVESRVDDLLINSIKPQYKSATELVEKLNKQWDLLVKGLHPFKEALKSFSSEVEQKIAEKAESNTSITTVSNKEEDILCNDANNETSIASNVEEIPLKSYNDDNLCVVGTEEGNSCSKTVDNPEESENIISHIYSSFFASEKIYHDTLYCLKMFNAAILNFAQDESNTAVISDTQRLFGKVLTISKFHEIWFDILENKKGTQDELKCIAEFFTALRDQLPIYKDNAVSHQTYVEILAEFRRLKGVCDIIQKVIDTNNIKMSFEDAIDRPTTRMSEYFCTLNNIIENTNKNDPSYSALKNARDEVSIYYYVTKYILKDKLESFRPVAKSRPIVEINKDGIRRLRLLIIYTDYIICLSVASKGNYDIKWFYPLKKTYFSPENPSNSIYREITYTTVNSLSIYQLKDEIVNLRQEICQHNSKIANKNLVEKLQKSLFKKKTELFLKLSSIPLRLYFPMSKSAVFLCITERTFQCWKNVIEVRHNSPLIEEWPLTQSEIQAVAISGASRFNLLVQKDLDKLDRDISSSLSSAGSSHLIYGKLFVSILIRRSPTTTADFKCYVFMDRKIKRISKTKSKHTKLGVTYKKTFTFDLENSAGYLYITFIRKRIKTEENLGGFVLDLIAEGIMQKPYLRSVKEFKGGQMLLFIEYSPTDQAPQYIDKFNPRNPSVEDIVKSECSEIPSIISLSIESIQQRGLTELGIYRLSGVTSQAVKLGKDWNEGWIITEKDLELYDVHVVASNLKSFLRELEQPLLSPEVIKLICEFDFSTNTFDQFLKILDNLPETNRKSFVAIMNHLVLVEQNQEENKMSAQNLATVFGVNLFGLASTSKPGQIPNELTTDGLVNKFLKLLLFWILRYSGS